MTAVLEDLMEQLENNSETDLETSGISEIDNPQQTTYTKAFNNVTKYLNTKRPWKFLWKESFQSHS